MVQVQHREGEPSSETGVSWRHLSACRSRPEQFVALRLTPREEREARAVCASCMVADECLAYAITHDVPYGIWGGLTTSERSRLRRSWLDSLAS